MSALAVLTCQPKSHPFQERHLALTEPIKIGRAVARARPASNNAIFDCKVLSRNHALLWYSNGKFFLQDTKSSNGTFINNQRLSKGSEESAPHEIFSGDVVQFGVDVMENSRNVTHGCIIATMQLFVPDGREALPSHSSGYLGSFSDASVQSQELYQLAQYLQEALHREQMLESKLSMLQRLLQNTQEASETGWQALIDEDRLLSRLEVLENQLQAYSKNQTEETLRQELAALQEDKYNYETTAKESLRKVLQEKLDAVRKLSELERSLSNTEDECIHLKEMCEVSQKELQELAEKHQDQLTEVASLREKLEEAEQMHEKELVRVKEEKEDLQNKIEEMVKEGELLGAKLESLQADSDFAKEQLTNMKARMEAVKEKSQDSETNIENHDETIDNRVADETIDNRVNDETIDNRLSDENGDHRENQENGEDHHIPNTHSLGIQVELVNMLDLQMLQGAANGADDDDDDIDMLREKLKETQELIAEYRNKLQESEVRLKESRQTVDDLQNRLDEAQSEIVSQHAKMSLIEENMKLSDMHTNQVVENAVADLKIQLSESRKQSDNSTELGLQLKDEVSRLEAEINRLREENDHRNVSPADKNDVTNSNSISNHVDHTATNHLRQEIDRLKDVQQESALTLKLSRCQIELLQELLQEAREAQRKSEADAERYKNELEDARKQVKKSTEETSLLQTQLFDSQQHAKDQGEHVTTLQDQLNKAEGTTKEVKLQILQLRDRLLDEQEQARLRHEEVSTLRKQLQEAQQVAKQSKNEAEQLRMRVKSLQEELDLRAEEVPVTHASLSQATHTEVQRQAAKNRDDDEVKKEEESCVASENTPPVPRGVSDIKRELEEEDEAYLSGEALTQDVDDTADYMSHELNKTDEDRVAERSVEFAALKEECANLRRRIQDIECEMKTSRKENQRLQTEYMRLQESYKELEELKDKLETNESTWKINLTDAQKDADKTKHLLIEANNEISVLKDKCSAYRENITQLKTDLEEYDQLSYRSKTVFHCSMIPLCFLAFGFLLALYPWLSEITATRSLT